MVALNPLTNEEAARVFFRRAPRRITASEMGVSSPMDVIRALSRHPLVVGFIRGHPGRIVDAVSHLNGATTITELQDFLRRREILEAELKAAVESPLAPAKSVAGGSKAE